MENLYYRPSASSGPEELKEKGSRFLGFLIPARSREEAEEALELLRKRYHDATHVCFAYRIRRGEIVRSSDDGEPSGTAGVPILQELKREDLWDALAAVVRYYGGVKLGTGGLARAYSETARLAVQGAPRESVVVFKRFSLRYPYALAGEVASVCGRFNLSPKRVIQGMEGMETLLEIEEKRAESFLRTLKEVTRGGEGVVIEELSE